MEVPKSAVANCAAGLSDTNFSFSQKPLSGRELVKRLFKLGKGYCTVGLAGNPKFSGRAE